MEKNTCPHCGAWGQMSRFCTRCGKSIIYSSIKVGQEEFKDKTIATSTKKTDFPIIIFWGIVLSVCVTILLNL